METLALFRKSFVGLGSDYIGLVIPWKMSVFHSLYIEFVFIVWISENRRNPKVTGQIFHLFDLGLGSWSYTQQIVFL